MLFKQELTLKVIIKYKKRKMNLKEYLMSDRKAEKLAPHGKPHVPESYQRDGL